MADTTSIASRMEKLAQLKRMKQGLSSGKAIESDETKADTQIEPTATVPDIDPVTDTVEAETSAPKIDLKAATSDGFETSFEAFAEAEIASPQDDFAAAFSDADEFNATDEAGIAEDEAAEVVSGVDFDSDSEIPEDLLSIEDDVVALNGESNPSQRADSAEVELPPIDNLSDTKIDIHEESDGALDEIAAIAGVGVGGIASATAIAGSEENIDAVLSNEIPDFASQEIPADLLDKEFEDETGIVEDTTVASEAAVAPIAEEGADGRVSLTFDDSRSTLLNHVSRQMGCSIEDVVVTALDWYLDALFGEDDEAKSA